MIAMADSFVVGVDNLWANWLDDLLFVVPGSLWQLVGFLSRACFEPTTGHKLGH